MTEAWRDATLSELCSAPGFITTGPFGSQLHSSDYSDLGVPVIMPTNLRGGLIETEGIARVSEETASGLARHRLLPGDIVYARRGDITKRALIRESQKGWLCGTGCLHVRPNDSADPAWIAYALGDPFVHEWLIARAVGATMPNLNTGILAAVPLRVPPLSTQLRIVVVLESIDRLIEKDRLLLSDIAALQRTFFARAAAAMPRVRLGDVAEITGGQSPPGDTYNEAGAGLPFHQGIRDFGRRFPTTRVYCSEPKRTANSGDALLAVRAPIGLTNIADQDLAIGRGLAALRFDTPAIGYQAMNSDPQMWSMHEGSGTVFASINKKAISDALVPWSTSAADEAFLSLLDEQYSSLTTEVETLTATRDILLPLLVSGRVLVEEVDHGAGVRA